MILIIDKSKSDAKTFAEIFHFMGVLSYGTTPSEALAEINRGYRATVIAFPERIHALDEYLPRLRRICADIPIFAISADSGKCYGDFDAVYSLDTLSSTMLSDIGSYCIKNSLPCIGSYRISELDASADIDGVVFGGREILLTKTEKMVLRYLIRTYPVPQSPTKILKHAFRESRAPLVASVRTHIHQINKKLSELSGAPKIESVGTDGYMLAVPVFAETV